MGTQRECSNSPLFLKRKWVLFAFGHYFANDLSEEDAVAWFSQLVSYNNQEQVELLLALAGEKGPSPWPEYERMNAKELVDAMYNLASYAQELSNLPEEY